MQLLCAAAAFQTARAARLPERNAQTEVFAKASSLLGKARALDHREQLPQLGSALLALAKVDLPPLPYQ